MNTGKYVFRQMTDFLPKRVFDGIVKRLEGDKWLKGLTCWNHLLLLIFGQLSGCNSLREPVCIVSSIKKKSYGLGFGTKPVSLHDVNAMDQIPYEPNAFYIFDKGYFDLGRLYTINAGSSYFIIREKVRLKYEVADGEQLLDGDDNVLLDRTIRVNGQRKGKYPAEMRRIVYFAPELYRTFTYLTNNFSLKAKNIAMLYKQRWQVELFFRWIKQHLRVKAFWGISEYAVTVQVYVAVITYCLIAIVEHDCELNRTPFNVIRVVSRVLSNKTPLRDLFDGSETIDDSMSEYGTQLELDFSY